MKYQVFKVEDHKLKFHQEIDIDKLFNRWVFVSDDETQKPTRMLKGKELYLFYKNKYKNHKTLKIWLKYLKDMGYFD